MAAATVFPSTSGAQTGDPVGQSRDCPYAETAHYRGEIAFACDVAVPTTIGRGGSPHR
jgi:hypothetical protein